MKSKRIKRTADEESCIWNPTEMLEVIGTREDIKRMSRDADFDAELYAERRLAMHERGELTIDQRVKPQEAQDGF